MLSLNHYMVFIRSLSHFLILHSFSLSLFHSLSLSSFFITINSFSLEDWRCAHFILTQSEFSFSFLTKSSSVRVCMSVCSHHTHLYTRTSIHTHKWPHISTHEHKRTHILQHMHMLHHTHPCYNTHSSNCFISLNMMLKELENLATKLLAITIKVSASRCGQSRHQHRLKRKSL